MMLMRERKERREEGRGRRWSQQMEEQAWTGFLHVRPVLPESFESRHIPLVCSCKDLLVTDIQVLLLVLHWDGRAAVGAGEEHAAASQLVQLQVGLGDELPAEAEEGSDADWDRRGR